MSYIQDYDSALGHKLIELPDVRQPDDYSCGSACVLAVTKYFGVGLKTIEEVKKELHTTRADSTMPDAITGYLSSLGLNTIARDNLSIRDLEKFWLRNYPVICPIQEYMTPEKKTSEKYGHWVTVIGLMEEQVVVFDPSIDNVLLNSGAINAVGKMMIDNKKWLRCWHDEFANERYYHFGIAVGK